MSLATETLSPDALFVGDCGATSRNVTKSIAAKFAFSQMWYAAELAEKLDMARLTVAKRIKRFNDLGLLLHTPDGWQATNEGWATMKRAVEGGN